MGEKCGLVLTIAGSDSSCGAGIQADLKTFAAFGCYGMSAITALTAQNTLGVLEVEPASPRMVYSQIKAILDDIGCDAIKIGMLHSAPLIKAVLEALDGCVCPIVLDPVTVSTSGRPLLDADGLRLMREELLPVVSLVTPNLPEAALLLGKNEELPNDVEPLCRQLGDLGCEAVLLTGGHSDGALCTDLLFEVNKDLFHRFTSKKIESRNLHGTGCSLAAAVAASLAKKRPLPEAVMLAKQFLDGAISAATTFSIGGGNGPLHHFWQWWQTDKSTYGQEK